MVIFFASVAPGFAHDLSHPELNAWFDSLKSGRGLCCSFTDGFAVSDVDWESKDGHYRVRLENNWIDVPDEALITEPNRPAERWSGRRGMTANLYPVLHAGQYGLGPLLAGT